MLPKSSFFTTLCSILLPLTLAQTDLASGIDSITTLTRVGTAIMDYVVYTDNAVENRLDVIGIVNAITTQASLVQDSITGVENTALLLNTRSVGSGPVLAGKMKRAVAFSAEEQSNITASYSALINVTETFMGFTMAKHDAIVAHNAAYQVAQALNTTANVLDSLTDVISPLMTLQTEVMVSQKTALLGPYRMIVGLYAGGEA